MVFYNVLRMVLTCFEQFRTRIVREYVEKLDSYIRDSEPEFIERDTINKIRTALGSV